MSDDTERDTHNAAHAQTTPVPSDTAGDMRDAERLRAWQAIGAALGVLAQDRLYGDMAMLAYGSGGAMAERALAVGLRSELLPCPDCTTARAEVLAVVRTLERDMRDILEHVEGDEERGAWLYATGMVSKALAACGEAADG